MQSGSYSFSWFYTEIGFEDFELVYMMSFEILLQQTYRGRVSHVGWMRDALVYRFARFEDCNVFITLSHFIQHFIILVSVYQNHPSLANIIVMAMAMYILYMNCFVENNYDPNWHHYKDPWSRPLVWVVFSNVCGTFFGAQRGPIYTRGHGVGP